MLANYIRLSIDLSIPLPVLLSGKVISHRWAQVYFRFYDMEYEWPRREDYYSMQVAAQVSAMLSSGKQKINLDDFRLKFQAQSDEQKKRNAEASRNRWFAALGLSDPKDPRKKKKSSRYLNSRGERLRVGKQRRQRQ